MRAFVTTIVFMVLFMIGMGFLMYRFNYQKDHAQISLQGNIFKVEIADSVVEHTNGLQGRSKIGAEKGMLFIFSDRTKRVFWMKDMKIPLDIIWIDGNRVIDLTKNAKPEPGVAFNQLKAYQPISPVTDVLEVAAGTIDRLNIKIGDDFKII